MKAVGVSRYCHQIEQAQELEDYEVSPEGAQQVADWYTKRLGLTAVRVETAPSRAHKQGFYDRSTRTITLRPSGFNLCTVVHEIAHHLQRCSGDQGSHHSTEFHIAHQTVLALVDKLFLAKYGGEVDFGYKF